MAVVSAGGHSGVLEADDSKADGTHLADSDGGCFAHVHDSWARSVGVVNHADAMAVQKVDWSVVLVRVDDLAGG